MTWWYWKYSEVLERITTAGAIAVVITTSKQQIIRPLAITISSISGDDDGGTSETTAILNFEPSSANIYFLRGETNTLISLPSDDYLGRFETVDLKGFVFAEEDELFLGRTYMSVGGKILFTVRALLSSYALPTVTISSSVITNVAASANYQNDIVGVME